jgi:polyisoprenoid-binding protein YceI
MRVQSVVRRAVLVAATGVVVGGSASAQGAFREFRIEAAHSQVGFTISFLGHPVHGRFDDVAGTLVYVNGKPEASSITARIATSSINTASSHRDGHLRSSDFFDAAKFPIILFQSGSVRRSRNGLLARGNLSMHGVTRLITIPFRETSAPVKDPHGSTLVYFEGSTKVSRKDYGIVGGSKYNSWFDNLRSAALGDSVAIVLEVEGWAVDYDQPSRYDTAIAKVAADGVGPTVARFRAMYKSDPAKLKDSEWEFDQIGETLLQRGKTADALAILGLTAEIFSSSPGAQSALAHAYEVAGDRAAASQLVAKALALDPAETRALEIRRRLIG